MTIDALDVTYSEAEIRDFIEDAVARKGTEHRPRFYQAEQAKCLEVVRKTLVPRESY